MVLWINCSPCKQGLEVIKLQYSLRLKIKRKDWLFYFESENELKFDKLKARGCRFDSWLYESVR